MTPLIACFLSGCVVGAIGYWAARKIYWYNKLPKMPYRHKSILRFRRYRFHPRRSPSLSRVLRGTYSGYSSDYRLNKLFEKIESRDND
jgi:hypothetical protein